MLAVLTLLRLKVRENRLVVAKGGWGEEVGWMFAVGRCKFLH